MVLQAKEFYRSSSATFSSSPLKIHNSFSLSCLSIRNSHNIMQISSQAATRKCKTKPIAPMCHAPRRVEYIENVNGRQLDSGGRGMGRAVTQTLARAQIQLISTNFSNCSTKEKQEEEGEEKDSTCPVANKEKKRKIAKNQLKKFCLRSGKSHAHLRPSPLLYIHTRDSRQEN